MPRDFSSTIARGEPISLLVDGQLVQAFAGETLATALLAHGISTFNRTASGQARGAYCNMGTCFECQVQIATAANSPFRWTRACMMAVCEGMIINTGAPLLKHPQIPAELVSDSDEYSN